MNRLLSSALAFAVISIPAVPIAHAGLVFTIEGPGVQSTTVPGVTTDDFNDNVLSPSALGTFSGTGFLKPASQYGGAGGIGYFLQASGDGATDTTLTFSVAQKYMGFWWSAGDNGNILDVFGPSNALLGTYLTSSLIPFLTSAYYGNPSGPFLGQNSGEPYAYLNFTATGSDSISKVVFRGTNFEVDNISITTQSITPPGITPGGGVPDAGATSLLFAAALAGLLPLRRRSRRE